MIDISGAIAVTALLWTIYQQYAISKICGRCPYFPANSLNDPKVPKEPLETYV